MLPRLRLTRTPTASGSFADGKYILSLGIPQGQKGDTGNQGIQGVTGVGISKVEQTGGTHAAGTLDTYTIYFTDGTTTTFQIYNGANGEGSGDFLANGTVPMTGNLNMNSHKVMGVATPTADTDAAPKGYVDSAAEARIPATQKGQAGGVATLDDSGKVPSAQLPSMDYIPTSQKGAANGVAELDSAGRVPSSQLPSYVDDVLEFTNRAAFPATGEDGKIYIAEDTNLQYRWSGSQYVKISPSLALGETSSTAYRGDRGKTAYDHSQITTGNPHGTTAADVGAATPSAVNAVKPFLRTATLTTSGWASNSQAVTVSGVVADSSAQRICASPADKASAKAWGEAGVFCSAQGANSLTFVCDSAPSANINVNISIQAVQS